MKDDPPDRELNSPYWIGPERASRPAIETSPPQVRSFGAEERKPEELRHRDEKIGAGLGGGRDHEKGTGLRPSR